ncbi:thiol-disulfide oxidoreductase DCC family protein [Halomonas sp. LS-001]
MPDLPRLKVYYDGACPGCRRDRARYERWAGETGRDVIWCDLNEHYDELSRKGIDPQAALMSLHIEEANGEIKEGIPAYIALMRRVPRLKPLAWVIGLPGIRHTLRYAYDHWVRRRLKREGRLPE